MLVGGTLVLTLGVVRAESTRGRWPHSDRGLRPARIRALELRETGTRPTADLSWADAIRQSSSPEEISNAVGNRVKYSRDRFKEDEWRSGRETWHRGAGDCEDYAATVKDLCTEKKLTAKIVIVHSKTAGKSHAVTMGEVNGRVWVSSNGTYAQYQSLHDAKQEIARDLGWWGPATEMFTVKQSQTDGGRQYVKMGADTLR